MSDDTLQVKPAPAKSAIMSRVQQWNNRVDDHKAVQAANPFGSRNAKSGTPAAPRKGSSDYGKAPAGSKSEARARNAQQWVEKEVAKLVDVIEKIGKPGANGKAVVTFGVLFDAYVDISDTLVGILMRSKKRRILTYKGDMLFQGMHNHVEIQLL